MFLEDITATPQRSLSRYPIATDGLLLGLALTVFTCIAAIETDSPTGPTRWNELVKLETLYRRRFQSMVSIRLAKSDTYLSRLKSNMLELAANSKKPPYYD